MGKLSALPPDASPTTDDIIPTVDITTTTTKKTTISSLISLFFNNIPTTSTPVTGWNPLGYTPDTITALGNRAYSMVFNGVDLTSLISVGMRLRGTRTSAAPNKCTSLNGTTQYYNKTTPNKLTFTDDFVISVWVKLAAYNSAAPQVIASRYNGTSGWEFRISASGQAELLGYNAGSANFSRVRSYQAIPINKWVNITAQLDMSAFTATTTTSYIMFDGIDVSASVDRAGTNPTALVQAGNLEIGSENGGTLPFNGKIAQVAIYNAKVTQATILASIHQTLTGSETSLASAYSFNNSIADLNTTTPNDLTAQGSAVATNADSPFSLDDTGAPGAYEFGVITSKVFSTNTTITVQAPEGCAFPTSATPLSAMAFSHSEVPFGFPGSPYRWEIVWIQGAAGVANTSATFVQQTGLQMLLPVGVWDTSFMPTFSTTGGDGYLALSSATTSLSNSMLSARCYTSGASNELKTANLQATIVTTTTTTYYIIGNKGVATSVLTRGITDDASSYTKIIARFGYI